MNRLTRKNTICLVEDEQSLVEMIQFNLELDGYCESRNLAFEYNGKQHYYHTKYFHKIFQSFYFNFLISLNLPNKKDINGNNSKG